MKNLFVAVLLCAATQLPAQTISGLYSGTLYNDSTKGNQQYELALSEYRGKITGYAYATFVANDTFYYSIRRVKATRSAQSLVVEDEEMLANNFPVRPDKGVHRISYIPLGNLKETDTLSNVSGNWKTTSTKKFYSVPGTMRLNRDNDSAHSALMAHLQELRVLPSRTAATATRTEKEQPVTAQTKAQTKTSTVSAEKQREEMKKLDRTAVRSNSNADLPTLAYTARKTAATQTFTVVSDSLVLSFYDNGVVDGDIISVYINGNVIISNTKLLEAATKKTVYLPADSAELLLVAENLGSIPPNTGLLVVQDGLARYEVRFSADLQTNASIVFRKKKP
jgi:hypothetical protein